jgi:hypothetical protein
MQESNKFLSGSLFISSKDYFTELVESALEKRAVKTQPSIKSYLINLLEFYVPVTNFDDQSKTLAETYLSATQLEYHEKVEKLQRLADRSLYVSGFFGDSLNRKIIDVDYYMEIGESAYAALAVTVREDLKATIFKTFSRRFSDFVDVLTVVSQQSFIKGDESVLRLYEKYLKTGSELAKEKLIEVGVLNLTTESLKRSKQD